MLLIFINLVPEPGAISHFFIRFKPIFVIFYLDTYV